MTTTPADGNEPNRPTEDGPLAPTAPGKPLTRPQKTLIAIVAAGVLTIATLGFIGSYNAVTDLATAKGFGDFAHAFPIAIDAGIIAFLALDLLLTWLRMPYPLLRHGAWLLTAATIAFNAAAAWPDWLGVGMHAVIPILFVVAVEAARHAIGRIADITADKHIEGPPISRWLLNPPATFILWRRQRMWGIRSWDAVVDLERERRIYRAKLRKQYGRAWRRKANADQILVLRLTADGMSVQEAIELPYREEAKRREEAARLALAEQQAEDERRRKALEYAQEQQRLEDERRRQAEAERLEQERLALELEKEREEAERQRRIAEAEAQARLAEIARQQQEAQAEAERRRRQEQLEHARRVAAEEQRAAEAARARKTAEELARLEAERKEEAARRAADMLRAANANASATPAPASRPASASRPAANASASAPPNDLTGPASAASGTAANEAANASTTANASTSQAAASTASAVDIDQVVDVYQLLKEQLGKAPSDQKLGEALGVSRSRAQQLRTLAIQAGHTELAKPVRLAS